MNAATYASGPVAPESVIAIAGSELSGITAEVEGRPAPLLYSSLTQVNATLPDGIAWGPATLVVKRDPHSEVRVPLEIAPVSPGLFAGVVHSGYLILYGTGIRGRSSLSSVTVYLDGTQVTVEYAGPQGGFAGLDQINVRLPAKLAGTARVSVEIDGQRSNSLAISID